MELEVDAIEGEGVRDNSNTTSSALNPTKNQCAVGTTKTKGIFYRDIDLYVARCFSAVVKVAGRIRVVEVDGRR